MKTIHSGLHYIVEANKVLKGKWLRSTSLVMLMWLLVIALAALAVCLVCSFYWDLITGSTLPEYEHRKDSALAYALVNGKIWEYVRMQVMGYVLGALAFAPVLMYYLPVKFLGVAREQPLTSINVHAKRVVPTAMLMCALPIIVNVGIIALILPNILKIAELLSAFTTQWITLASFTLSILIVIYMYTIRLTPYYANDNPDKSLLKLMMRSIRTTHGHKGKLFVIDLCTTVATSLFFAIMAIGFLFAELSKASQQYASSAQSATGSDASSLAIIAIIVCIVYIIVLCCATVYNYTARALLYIDLTAPDDASQTPQTQSDAQPPTRPLLNKESLITAEQEQAIAKESDDFLKYILDKNSGTTKDLI